MSHIIIYFYLVSQELKISILKINVDILKKYLYNITMAKVLAMAEKSMSWSYRENVILQKNYGKVTSQELLKLLPGKTLNSIYIQVSRLRKKGWRL